ncbi:semaphorin-4F isoform X1 [Xiphophorus maculatus]|uniref:Ssemaphorin 4F n=1 Tax=Xiphophorus maculatus TaxID=8083 RepID=A0A3B5QSE8_XIPMA|nr:semaphorin-4F isoform X1 [Xiphophorus maculatus]XP_023202647.1 semaphorin-4F isoform X1 [Xiphophorus maculatus]XP_023202648.1 semaphorin-4F isoform X1 [Xiphophorus maculatus]
MGDGMTLSGVLLVLVPMCCLMPGNCVPATLGALKAERETFKGVTNFSTFLLDSSKGTLFLGAKDAILAVDTNNLKQPPKKIDWAVPEEKRKSCVGKGKTEADCNNYIRLLEFLNDGLIYVCGTYAFDPQCAFLHLPSFTLEKTEDGAVKMETGKGKCPFEPNQRYTAVMADGILYTAATSNFLGTSYDICRATGPEQERVRTDQSINWLNDPEFVSSALIEQAPDSNPTGDDDKIYFFFTEMAKEHDLYTKVPRVVRVCKSDVGGMKTLQRRWTTFLKAQLVCEDKASGQRYNILTDVFTTQHSPEDPSSTHFYGLFTSQWEPNDISAVCVFSLFDISKVMDGPFKELKKTCENWNSPETVPTPRPGQCLNSDLKAQGFGSSLKLPDKVLTFVRDHPLMENSVTAAPLLVRKGIKYTTLAVTLMGEAEDRRGAVLHLGTDRGELHQVAVANQNATLLQEIPLFSPQEPVNNIIMHQGQALVGSPQSVAKVQTEGCALYSSCEVCARARGVGCEWSAEDKTCRFTLTDPGSGDVVDEALKSCDSQAGRCDPSTKVLKVSPGLQILLPCVQLSPRPCSWEYPPHRHTRQHHSDLAVTVTEENLGSYVCTCLEGGPNVRDPTPCRRAAFFLNFEEPNARGSSALNGNRHHLAIYVLLFFLGLVCGAILLYVLNPWKNSTRSGNRAPDNSLSSGKEQKLLCSLTTPQSQSSSSLVSDGFRSSEKQNGKTTSTTATTLLSSQGNGGPHANSYSGSRISSNTSNGHSLYSNCDTSGSGLKLNSEILVANTLGGRTGTRDWGRPDLGEKEAGEGNGVDELLGARKKGLEDEFVSLSEFQAPLAPCEESSI